MPEKKIIAVVGATGAQGGGLVRAILADPNGGFAVRAITRNVNSDAAKQLASLGAEVVAADVYDHESIRQAFDGARSEMDRGVTRQGRFPDANRRDRQRRSDWGENGFGWGVGLTGFRHPRG